MTESVTALADTLLTQARSAHSGRAAHTPVGGSGHVLRQTVIALCATQQLAEHLSPGEATLLVLRGKLEVRSDGATEVVTEGDLVVIPPEAHSLWAADDSVVLLSVAKLQ
jgi:quercetin dioxygenase-like cupin family protein